MHVIQKLFGPNYFFWSVLKVPPSDLRNVSGSVQVLKQRIKVDKLDFFKNDHSIWKILFVLGAYEYLERHEGKIKSVYSFKLYKIF
jgi:hypothetical protein